MKRICIIMALTLLTGALLWAEGQRRDGGNTFLEPLQQRDSVLIADQLRYGVVLENVQEGTPLALPEFQMPEDNPLRVVSGWQLDSTRVSGRKEKPARYDIKASLILTAYMGGQYELPTLPVLLDGDTLVFHPTQILRVSANEKSVSARTSRSDLLRRSLAGHRPPAASRAFFHLSFP